MTCAEFAEIGELQKKGAKKSARFNVLGDTVRRFGSSLCRGDYSSRAFGCGNNSLAVQMTTKKIEELEKDKEYFSDALDKQIEATLKVVNQLNEAKDIIKNIIHVTWGEGWNYSLDWKVKAEQFLKKE